MFHKNKGCHLCLQSLESPEDVDHIRTLRYCLCALKFLQIQYRHCIRMVSTTTYLALLLGRKVEICLFREDSNAASMAIAKTCDAREIPTGGELVARIIIRIDGDLAF